MKKIHREHLSSTLFVSLILFGLFIATRPQKSSRHLPAKEVQNLSALELDPNDPFQNRLFKDMAATFAGADSTRFLTYWQQLKQLQKAQAQLTSTQYRQKISNRISVGALFGMYWNFIWIYLLVIAFTYYGVQTLGTFLFLRYKQHPPPDAVKILTAARRALLNSNKKNLLTLGRACGVAALKIFVYFILFAPAYVLAYSIKSDFDTESTLFMILLGIVSNGVLIAYANKFYHFLLNESRKGYVRTAVVKNLKNDFRLGRRSGISWRALFGLRKNFRGHVLQHIFMNARFQYLATFKEQAAFIITGLIIIEMALNIHGHLSYELLQQLLYRNYDLAVLIIWGIFLLVKATEWATDVLLYRIKKRLGYQ